MLNHRGHVFACLCQATMPRDHDLTWGQRKCFMQTSQARRTAHFYPDYFQSLHFVILCFARSSYTNMQSKAFFSVCRRFVRKTYCQGDILSWIFVRHFVRKTFCQHVFCETFCQEDILSVQFFCGRILHRRFVRKTNCQDPFWPYFWYVDIIYGMFTLYLVFWPYFWYVYLVSGILTIFLVCWHYFWYVHHYIWYVDDISGMFTLCLVFWPYFLHTF